MMVNRRDFLKKTSLTAVATSLANVTSIGQNHSTMESQVKSEKADTIVDRDDEIYKQANTDWLARCRYGMGICWTPLSTPRKGWPVCFREAVRDFDVMRFVDTVAATGAEFLIFTATHKYQYLPAPNPVIDGIQNGRTSKRDLIGEIAQGLKSRGIEMILYYNHSCNVKGDYMWKEAAGYHDRDMNRFFNNLFNILDWMGKHYGDLIKAWWFDSISSLTHGGPRDTVSTDMGDFKVPWHRFTRAAKAGYSERLVTYNSAWSKTYMYTSHQDYWAGELRDLETDPPSSRFKDNGLQWHGWVPLDGKGFVHTERDTEITDVNFSDNQIIQYVRTCIKHQAPVALNLSIYQDGGMSPRSLRQMQIIKNAVK